VVQDVELVGDRDGSREQFSDGTDNLVRFEVSRRVVIAPSAQDTGVVSPRTQHQLMEKPKIVVVVSEQHTASPNGMHQMGRVLFPRHTRLPWRLHIMSGPFKQPDQRLLERIIIHVKVHRP
jgi:hypothetical protein